MEFFFLHLGGCSCSPVYTYYTVIQTEMHTALYVLLDKHDIPVMYPTGTVSMKYAVENKVSPV